MNTKEVDPSIWVENIDLMNALLIESFSLND